METEKEINKKISEMVLKALDEGWSATLRKLAALLNKRAEFEEIISDINSYELKAGNPTQ